MRFFVIARLALIIVVIAAASPPSEAADIGAAAWMSRSAARTGFVEKAHWARRCGRRNCWRVWIPDYYGPPTVRDSCILWRATHWGLRRVWVC